MSSRIIVKPMRICLLTAALALGISTIGCGGGSATTITTTPPPPVISVSFPGGNAQTIILGQAVTITANVSNDPSGRGVAWTVTGPGALSQQNPMSAEYTAPCLVTSNQKAMVTATSLASTGASATFTVTVAPPAGLTNVSCDTFTNSSSQHATEVEPDTFAFGSTIVSAFQVGRIFSGGSADIGFATSTNGGVTWTNGFLPGLTMFQAAGGATFNAASDPSVAFDAKHGQWIIASIVAHEDVNGNFVDDQIVVSESPDGVTWGNPITVVPVGAYDKDWIVCDNTSTSPFFGHCYIEWTGFGKPLIALSTSTDGGLTWQAPLNTADMAVGGGGQPVVQPNGTVIDPHVVTGGTNMASFTSADGGASWSATTIISSITHHTEDGNLRSGPSPLPSAEIDAAGTVYVVWADCRFRTNCSSNDLVLSTSSDGVTWTAPARIPIDPVTSTVDHFIPGLAVDRTTSGNTAHLTLTYYDYPVSACTPNCDLDVSFVSSQDGGQTWSAPVQLAGPMKLSWLPNTFAGVMVGDYISTSYVNGNAFSVFAVAAANNGSVFDEAMYTTTQPLLMSANPLRFSSEGEMPVPNAKSDHPPRDFQPEFRRPPP